MSAPGRSQALIPKHAVRREVQSAPPGRPEGARTEVRSTKANQ